MHALDTLLADTMDARFRRAITLFCAREGTSPRAFGMATLNDPGFVAALARGRSPRLSTVDRALAFMGQPPAGPAFRAEVEAFLGATGAKRSLLGRAAIGNPSFVAQLHRGTSPMLRTVDRVRAWMAAHASAAERWEIERRIGAMPSVLSGMAAIVGALLLERTSRPEAKDHGPEQLLGPGDRPAYVSTLEAAGRLGLSPRIRKGRVVFRLEDGRRLDLDRNDPQLRHLDHAWASTVHAFQGRTVDNAIAAMAANHPNLTTQKSFYVEISRARDRAELVTDDAAALKERLETVTGERISALEGIGENVRPARERDGKASVDRARPERDKENRERGRPAPPAPDRDVGREPARQKAPEPEPPAKGRRVEMDLAML